LDEGDHLMAKRSTPYKPLLWFARQQAGELVTTVIVEYHAQSIEGYVSAALNNKSGQVKVGPFRFKVVPK
jgi:hypothetical protein